MTYTIKVIYNAPGLQRVTIQLSHRLRGVVFEVSGPTVEHCMANITAWIVETA